MPNEAQPAPQTAAGLSLSPRPQPSVPIRVLHWIWHLGGGGVETWFLQLLDHLDPDEFEIDVMVGRAGGVREEEARRRGCRVFECAYNRPVSLLKRLRAIMRDYGPYDVLHSHVGSLSWLACVAAYCEGVKVRIVHSRGASEDFPQPRHALSRAYVGATQFVMRQCATHLLAISSDAAEGLYGRAIKNNPKYRSIVTAIDLETFGRQVTPSEIKAELCIPPEAPIVAHVARFTEYKNHDFLVEIAEHLVDFVPEVRFLLIGDGPRKPEIEEQVRARGLQDHFIFTGFRLDIPRLLEAANLFVFPSRWEGLGRVVVEAQAAGVPCLISNGVPPEATVVEELVTRICLSAGPEAWARAARELLSERPALAPEEALRRVRASEFNIEVSALAIADIYRKARPGLLPPRPRDHPPL